MERISILEWVLDTDLRLDNMDERTIKISFQTAKKLYKSDNKALKEVALQAFSEEELTSKSFRDIETFEDACKYLEDNNICKDLLYEYTHVENGSYSETLCKYRIIVAALTNNEKRNLDTGDCYMPIVQFCELGKEKNCYGNKKLGTIKHEGKKYAVVGGSAIYCTSAGLGCFNSFNGVSYTNTGVSFRSVSSHEIAEYISEQFGRLLFEVLYKGTNCNWEWVD